MFELNHVFNVFMNCALLYYGIDKDFRQNVLAGKEVRRRFWVAGTMETAQNVFIGKPFFFLPFRYQSLPPTHPHTHTHLPPLIHTHTYKHTLTHTPTDTHRPTHTHTHTHYTHYTRTQTYTHTHTHTHYTHYTCTHTLHTRTHTHTTHNLTLPI